ncbi:MAG: hypothetical protein LBQ74_13720 [Prevotella sp.]|jgi:hypothetical protein|nr:hypothetical protein [Prevotella sp.]
MIDRYDVNNFINKCIGLDFPDLLIFSHDEYKSTLNRLGKIDRDTNYKIMRYNDFVHEFLFFIQSGIKPAGMRDDDFNRTKPIIEKLVEKGQLKRTILEMYQ